MKASIEEMLGLVDEYVASKRWMEAMVVAKKVQKLAPSDFRARFALAEVYAGQAKPKLAIPELDAVLAITPSHRAGLALRKKLTPGRT
jgi:hypothetical protein